MILLVALILNAFSVSSLSSVISSSLRRDGVDVVLHPGTMSDHYAQSMVNSIPFRNFSEAYVENAKKTSIDWREKGAVTPAKDQGPLGFCGTFGRTAAAEGRFAIHGNELRNFSEEELIDCIGWDQDQFSYFAKYGFMDMFTYPYIPNGTTTDEPPIPGKPCKYDSSKVISGTGFGNFANITGKAPSEDQLVAFLFHNGPVNTGINANVFGLREKDCESTKDCFITEDMCNDPTIKSQPIDHSITLVGYGTDSTRGDYWIVKNSWSKAFANDGFIKVARGISCAHIDCCGWIPTYGDVNSYFEAFY